MDRGKPEEVLPDIPPLGWTLRPYILTMHILLVDISPLLNEDLGILQVAIEHQLDQAFCAEEGVSGDDDVLFRGGGRGRRGEARTAAAAASTAAAASGQAAENQA